MLALVAGRAAQLLAVVVGIITILFFLLRVSGDPVLVLLGPEGVTDPDVVTDIRRRYGLEEPILVQYVVYMGRMFTLDFGESIFQHRSALTIALERVPASLILAGLSMVVALSVGLMLGIGSALTRSRFLSTLLAALSVVGQSFPVFFVGLVGLLVFSATLRWLPAFGFTEPASLILPVITLALLPMARVARISRASMVEVLQQEYVLTARAKGLPGWLVVTRHCLRNMLVPVVTLAGYDFIQLFGTATVAEVVFAWPGVGSQLVTSGSQRDYPVVQAIAFLVAVAAVAISLVVDIAYRFLDPRLREVPR